MNEQKLSKRLASVAHYVRKNDRVADIGSDHAYLPAWLVLNQQIEYAVAGEVVEGPYQAALKLVKQRKLDQYITVRLGDGLDAIVTDDDISAITIAGMGGSLISDILERGHQSGRLNGKERLILQPNVGEKTLRTWLMNHSYEIIAETLVMEDGRFYEIIVAEKVAKTVKYSLADLTFGVFLRTGYPDLFKEKWQADLLNRKRVLKQLEQARQPQLEKIAEMTHMIKLIEAL
ncbi:tRNA (adenine(22)-N(1))-methyltransferase TrmK [uncultured Vagococcus sp.]|uniref:tRNA (adenine(22)-N(1))-methyltransferase n=1 Tax=uncultured Vagococcus sp. TaxID=189676 RepID=UPI0028D67AD6|nr:tRNA (adenine(22)-N(1))-methyltransferase TrmK [uncultured Vagococcus sp.]